MEIKLKFNDNNIIRKKSNEIVDAILYYSVDYDNFQIIIISKCDMDSIIYEHLEIDNLNYKSKDFAIRKFNELILGGGFEE